MAEKKDYYFEGRIYQDVTIPFPKGTFRSMESYNIAFDNWVSKVNKEKSFIVSGYHNWKNGQDVTGLYELQYQLCKFYIYKFHMEWVNCDQTDYDESFPQNRRIVAIPSPVPEVKDMEAEARELVEKFFHCDKNNGCFINWRTANQCAIKHCELMLEYLTPFDPNRNHYTQLIEQIKNL